MGDEIQIVRAKGRRWLGRFDTAKKRIYLCSNDQKVLMHEIIEYLACLSFCIDDTRNKRTIRFRHNPFEDDQFSVFVQNLYDTLKRNGFLRG
jgi:hypothetical protein